MFMLFPGPTRLLKVVEISWESGSRGLPGPVVISTLKGQEGMPVVEASSDRTNDATITMGKVSTGESVQIFSHCLFVFSTFGTEAF